MGISTDGKTDFNAMTDEELVNASDDIPMFEPIEKDSGSGDSDSDNDSSGSDDSSNNDEQDAGDDNQNSSEEPDDNDDDSENDDDNTGDTQDDDDNSDDSQNDSDDNSDKSNSDDDNEETDDSDGNQDSSDDDDLDFESGYKDILKPFKANGKEMQVDSVEDARQLMQMGAGFSKKMQKLKPHLKIVKSLKDNDLLDQEKLDHLIDLSNGSPEAIAKLMKDKGVDPLDIKLDGAGDYKPKSHEVSDSAFNLDEAIDNIRGTDTFEKSMDVMGKQWDEASRTLISENPDIVGVINDHVQSGVFETVQAEVDKQRALGRMVGTSDVEAYREAAGTLQKNGTLVGNGSSGADDNRDPKKKSKSDSKGDSLKREAKKVNSKKKADKVKAKKRAAAPSGGSGKTPKKAVDLSGLSDEEFLKEYEKL